jgi:hypothetical protein
MALLDWCIPHLCNYDNDSLTFSLAPTCRASARAWRVGGENAPKQFSRFDPLNRPMFSRSAPFTREGERAG